MRTDLPREASSRVGTQLEAQVQGFTFQTTKSVLAEAGSLARIGELVKGLGCSSVFLVSDAATKLYSEAARIVVPDVSGDDAARTGALIGYFSRLAPELGLPTRLRDVGIKQEHMGQLAEDAMKQTRLLVNNPREVTLADASEIYGAVL